MPTQVQLSAPDWLRPFGQGVEDLSEAERRDVRRRMHTDTPVRSEMPLSPGSLMAIAGMMPALFGGAKYLPQAGAVVRRIPETLRNAMRTGDSVAVAKTPVGRIGAAQKTRRELLGSLFPLQKVVDIGRTGVELGNPTPAEVDDYAAAEEKIGAIQAPSDVFSPEMVANKEIQWDIEDDIAQRQRAAWAELGHPPQVPDTGMMSRYAEGVATRPIWKKFQDIKRRISQYPVGRPAFRGPEVNVGGDIYHAPGSKVVTPHRPNTIKAHVETGAQLIGEEFIQALAAEASEKLGRHVSEEEIRRQIDEASGVEGAYDKLKAALTRRFRR